MLETGRTLQDRYRVEKQVGQGGMGSVYLATDKRFHSTVAIKETLFGDEKLRKAFSREARLLNSLKHSALPKVTDHFVEDNGQYIVMEYIGGDDLFEMMRKSGLAFPVEDVLEWADQLLDALSYLHEQGIIHRDIKPQNLKLTPQKQIILLDFGLAKGNPTDANFQTAPHSIFGYSRNYASLEQIQGTGTDPRSDFYSLAATMYHLITGQVPADALTRVMMVVNDDKDPLEPAGKFVGSISQEVSDALQACLSLKAGSRPQNVEEMRQLLNPGKHTPFSLPEPENLTDAGRSDLLTQNTLVLENADVARRDKRSEMKTEVLGTSQAAESVKTKFSNNPTAAIPEAASDTERGKSRFGLAAAGAGIFLVVGSIAAAAVLWIGGETTIVPVANSNISNAVEAQQDQSNSNVFIPAGNALTEDLGPGGSSSNEADRENEITGKRPGGTTAETRPAAVTKEKAPKPNADMTIVDGEDEITISNGTVRTRDAVVNEKGVIIRKATPGPITRDPRLTRDQWNKLSPAQKRRLLQRLEAERRAAEQRRREQPSQNPPPPPPPPKN